MINSAQLNSSVLARISRAREQIGRSLDQIRRGNPLGAEQEPERAVARLRAKASLDRTQATAVATEIRITAEALDRGLSPRAEHKAPGAEAVLGPTFDFVGISFLSRGRRVADAVVRLAFRSQDKPKGSGFLVAPGILITNNHVIGNAGEARELVAQIDYERDETGQPREITEFELDPRLLASEPIEGLDYSIVRLGARVRGPRNLASLPTLPLSAAGDKHMLGEVANLIQHPQGRYKELVIRENRLISRLDYVLHYLADTEPGSSGSPVFNNDWQVIALHHWGGPGPAVLDSLLPNATTEVNEGIRISSIVRNIESKLAGGVPDPGELAGLLEHWASRQPAVPSREISPPDNQSDSGKRRKSMPRSNDDFSDREGYQVGFIPGFVVPLPKLDKNHEPARNLEARRGDNPYELPYHHFSIVMNAERRLAYFTACNIDGRLTRHVKRGTTEVDMKPTLGKLQIERAGGEEGAEETDAFSIDDRVHPEEQMGIEFYRKQKVPGYADPQSGARRARMLQKGHIIMRGDPAWGKKEMALAAEQDTFYYTNAAPQLGFFNQGSEVGEPGMKGKLRWRAVETYVLRNAFTSRERICVFAGPVFLDKARDGYKKDPLYRGIQVPMLFWKIAVWAQDDKLRSIALLADQRPVLERLTKGMPEAMESVPETFDLGPERFDDVHELLRVRDYLSTVERIEALTGLTFPDQVRDGDIKPKKEDVDLEAAEKFVKEKLRARRTGARTDNGGNGPAPIAATVSSSSATKTTKRKTVRKSASKRGRK